MDLICDTKRILNRVSVFLSIRSIYNESRGKWNKCNGEEGKGGKYKLQEKEKKCIDIKEEIT